MTKLEENKLEEKIIDINLLALRLNILHIRPDIVKLFYSYEELLMIFGSMENYNRYLMLDGEDKNND